MIRAEVTALARSERGFLATWNGESIDAAAVVLACGIVDAHPPFQEWRGAVADGLLRTAPSVTLRIAVVGPLDQAAAKALFLRGYSRDVTLLATRLNRDNLKPGLRRRGFTSSKHPI